MEAVLFDLDGTLLASDFEEQIEKYMRRLSAYAASFAPELAPTLMRDMMGAVSDCMRERDMRTTVSEKFWKSYCGRTGAEREFLEPRFDVFYREEYGEIGAHYTPVPQMQEAVRILKAAGKKLCVATNCFYPAAAVEWRLRWAGLEPADFDAITHYENMHITKPHPEYFSEAAALLGVVDHACVMVGNNGKEDMTAGRTGMETFLLETFLIGGEDYKGPRGGYDDLLEWLGRKICSRL